MKRKIPLVAREQKRIYTGFLVIMAVMFVITTIYTEFNPMVLVKNGDAFWTFITEDFLPPALAKAVKFRTVSPSEGTADW